MKMPITADIYLATTICQTLFKTPFFSSLLNVNLFFLILTSKDVEINEPLV